MRSHSAERHVRPDPVDVVADQPFEVRARRRGQIAVRDPDRDRADIRARRVLGEDVGRGAVVDDRSLPLVGRQPRQQCPRQRLLAGQGPEARLRPRRDDGRVGPEERRRAADDLPVGQRDVDRDVVSADPPRPRRMGVGLAEDREPVELGVAPRPAAATAVAFERTEDRFEAR